MNQTKHALLLSTALSVFTLQASELQLEEVIVTAQKKAESLQDAPISLAAFGPDQLENQGVDGLDDLQAKVPNLSMDTHPTSSTTLRIYIRGIGTNDSTITLEPAVGVYQNGIYIARATGLASDLTDLERIEVLRGPQGTLYGRNTVGGAINMITQKPSVTESFGYAKYSAGSYGLSSLKLALNFPLSDALAVKLAYIDKAHNGYVENDGPGKNFGEEDARGFRMDALWDMSERGSLLLSFERSEQSFANYTPQAIRPSTNDGSNSDQVRQGANANTRYSESRQDSMSTAVALLPSDSEITGISAIYSLQLETAEFRSLTAVRRLENRNYIDLGGDSPSTDFRLDTNRYRFQGSGEELPAVLPLLEHEQISQEFQLLGDIGSAISYIAGFYYLGEEGSEDNRPEHHALSAPLQAPVLGLRLVSTAETFFEIENTAFALFGQATWTPSTLSERLHITFGARRSEDEKKAHKFLRSVAYIDNAVLTTPLPPPAPGQQPGQSFDDTGKNSFSDNSFSLTLAFDVSDDVNIYLKSSEAYKGGGFNVRDPDPDFFKAGFDQENVQSYELGIKSELLNRRLRLNANVFTTDYDDIQLSYKFAGSTGPGDTRVENIGKASIQGGEVDISYVLSQSLHTTLSYGYLKGDITEAIVEGEDRKDDFVLGNLPEHTLTGNLSYRGDFYGGSTLLGFIGFNFVDEQKGAAQQSALDRSGPIEGYTLWSARLGVNDIVIGRSSLHLAVWGRNLTDEEYAVTTLAVLPNANRSVYWGAPRSYGVDIRLDW
ncbi:MAG TPA: TonB-dependent receptor [Spongiibacteraceae bacterium]|nr:TonB-dependent receptor [Spongiibacteraceae bacterium]MBN51931.1 TonB-dependent receptor [Spongiibacteraceae bacterium]HCS26849.1 TonB-dependent receptor [Spongiibacteraceae bacterium]